MRQNTRRAKNARRCPKRQGRKVSPAQPTFSAQSLASSSSWRGIRFSFSMKSLSLPSRQWRVAFLVWPRRRTVQLAQFRFKQFKAFFNLKLLLRISAAFLSWSASNSETPPKRWDRQSINYFQGPNLQNLLASIFGLLDRIQGQCCPD